jgi:putative phosphoesterase
MRVAALYDIHGNLPALEAVLEELRRDPVDAIVIGGDVVPGPMPRETIARLRSLGVAVHCVAGNGEADVLASRNGGELARVPEAFRPLIHWTARQLEPEDEQWLASWPLTIRLSIAGIGDVLFCHATPRDDNEIFTKLTPDDRLQPVFGSLDVALVVCGHTHMPFDRSIGATRVVNAGSLGMPFGEPGADWLLLGPDVAWRHTFYDLAAAAARIRETRYPQAREFADASVLNPPAAATMLELFSKASL